VQDARYWREQATLCLEAAGRINDPRTADSLRATAGDYFARAIDLEAQTSAAAKPSAEASSKQSEQP